VSGAHCCSCRVTKPTHSAGAMLPLCHNILARHSCAREPLLILKHVADARQLVRVQTPQNGITSLHVHFKAKTADAEGTAQQLTTCCHNNGCASSPPQAHPK
jgi:hypothetical protein